MKKRKNIIIFSIVFSIIVISLISIINLGNANYQCYLSKEHDGFIEKSGWELMELQLNGNYDYSEIIRGD